MNKITPASLVLPEHSLNLVPLAVPHVLLELSPPAVTQLVPVAQLVPMLKLTNVHLVALEITVLQGLLNALNAQLDTLQTLEVKTVLSAQLVIS